jgi:tripartite ATP-independent transporter DctM subunit
MERSDMRKVLLAIDSGVENLLTWLGRISVALMLMLSAFIATQVFFRYVLNMHIRGLFDLSIYSLIVFTFLSAAFTMKEGQHISVDIFSIRLPHRSRITLELCGYLAGMVFVFILGWVGWKWARMSFASGVMTISELPVPKGLLIMSIVVGSFFLLVQTLRTAIHLIIKLVSRETPGPEETPGGSAKKTALIFITALFTCYLIAFYINSVLGLGLFVLLLLLSGMPVFMALGLTGVIGLYLLLGEVALRQTPFIAFSAVESFPLTCLPLFIIAGVIMEKGKVVDKVFLLFSHFSGKFVCTPLLATIFAGGFFCAISGSSVATTSLVAAVSLPVLLRQGYSRSLSSGVIAGATIGTVIPPSIGYILYGVITEESIGQLFIAGLIPAATIFAFYTAYIILRSSISRESLFEAKKVPAVINDQEITWAERFKTFKQAVWGLITPVFVLGGIYLGIFTPSEAAAVMVIYAIIVTMVIMRTLTFAELMRTVLVGAKVSSMILMIIVGAKIFGAATSQFRITANLVAFAENISLSPYLTIILVTFTLIIFGMFLDAASTMVITLPVFYPLIMASGFSSIWFGVYYIVVLEIGLLTPPVGLNIYVIKGLSNLEFLTILRGILPFLMIMILSLVLLILFPDLATWLPGKMIQ